MLKASARIVGLKNLEELSDIEYSEELQHEACLLAAYDIIKSLCEEGKITEEERKYIRMKYNIPVE